jgi:excisionase family DNA binding protein
MSLKTVNEMSQILRVSPKTFRNMVDIYNLPFTRVGARGKRFDEKRVMQKLETFGYKDELPAVKPKKTSVRAFNKDTQKYRELLGLV